jgi:Plasmid pRiA4b ORF-3-like protein
MKTYTFHVSLAGTGKCWRKIEIGADQTLEELHLAIQDAYEFDNDHLYSFFLSGKAWDNRTEYSLPEGVSPYGDLFFDMEDGLADEADFEDDEAEALPQALDLDTFLQEEVTSVTTNPEEAAQLTQFLETVLKADEDQLESLIEAFAKASGENALMLRLQIRLLRSMWDEVEGDIEHDVRRVTIEGLKLKVGREFMYLFDYGDEWRFKVRVHAINPTAPDGEYPRVVQAVGKPPPQYPEMDEEDVDWGEEDDDGGFVIFGDDEE